MSVSTLQELFFHKPLICSFLTSHLRSTHRIERDRIVDRSWLVKRTVSRLMVAVRNLHEKRIETRLKRKKETPSRFYCFFMKVSGRRSFHTLTAFDKKMIDTSLKPNIIDHLLSTGCERSGTIPSQRVPKTSHV